MVKNQPASSGRAREMGSSPGSGRSLRVGNGNPLLPAEFRGQRSLVGYSPRGHKRAGRDLTTTTLGKGINKCLFFFFFSFFMFISFLKFAILTLLEKILYLSYYVDRNASFYS